MPPVPPLPGLLGVDLSSRQPPDRTSWPAIAGAGVRWAYLRAAEGVTPDEAFAAHRDAARAAGVLTGAYQFARCRHPAATEADVLLEQLGDDPWQLPHCLDLERGGPADELEPAALLDWVHTWLERVGSVTGVPPLLYGGPGYLDAALPRVHDLGQVPLWLAAYTPRPVLPRGWSSWLLWQWSGSGRVAGYPGDADLSVWLAGEDELRLMAGLPSRGGG